MSGAESWSDPAAAAAVASSRASRSRASRAASASSGLAEPLFGSPAGCSAAAGGRASASPACTRGAAGRVAHGGHAAQGCVGRTGDGGSASTGCSSLEGDGTHQPRQPLQSQQPSPVSAAAEASPTGCPHRGQTAAHLATRPAGPPHGAGCRLARAGVRAGRGPCRRARVRGRDPAPGRAPHVHVRATHPSCRRRRQGSRIWWQQPTVRQGLAAAVAHGWALRRPQCCTCSPQAAPRRPQLAAGCQEACLCRSLPELVPSLLSRPLPSMMVGWQAVWGASQLLIFWTGVTIGAGQGVRGAACRGAPCLNQ